MNKIEVVVDENSTTKKKGDLLEHFSALFLKTQNYTITEQLRITATELDLLCKSNINQKEIYVECKAYRENLSADIPKKLLGTVVLHDYSEGWLITTGQFGKDAKGFEYEWQKKPSKESSKLSFFTPDKLIKSFIDSNLIISPERISFKETKIQSEKIGNWTLIISEYGNFWALECLEGGIPVGLLFFYANTGVIVNESSLLINLSKTDTSLKNLDFKYYFKLTNVNQKSVNETNFIGSVVPVQQGDSWDDYRPARPEDFVGRMDSQDKIIGLFKRILNRNTETRIFAITGNSGMGKSSLISKLRSRCRNQHHRNKYFLYAVDVRAAKDHTYIYSSIIKCFTEAMNASFINQNPIKITDFTNPFESESINTIIEELKFENKVICLVFDQFEELYSKPELFSIFETVYKLLLSVASLNSNFCLGFAWKTDSMVHQDHPAYHIWHSLSDLRLTIFLEQFSRGDSERSITIFEKEINRKLPREVRHQLINHSQGFPWLLKKLCIHLYNKLKTEESFSTLLDESLDIQFLFDKDLQELSTPERTCLKIVAEKAPVDWYEIIEILGNDVLKSLIDKRLIIKSGDRLNIYWDIFREYLLTGKVPSLPFNYLPLSPSINSLLKAVELLNHENTISCEGIAKEINVSEKTAYNIISDLQMFNIIKGKGSVISLNENVQSNDNITVLNLLRKTFTRHSAKIELMKLKEGYLVKEEDLIKVIKKINPTAQHNNKTLQLYAKRIGTWLSTLGYITSKGNDWIVEDSGKVNLISPSKRAKNIGGNGYCLYTTSPQKTMKIFQEIINKRRISKNESLGKGFKSALTILRKFDLIITDKLYYVPNFKTLEEFNNNIENLLLDLLSKENIFKEIENFISQFPELKGTLLGELISKKYNFNWSDSTNKRIGNSLFLWFKWLKNNKIK